MLAIEFNGEHARKGGARDNNAVHNILSDWYEVELFDFKRIDALRKPITSFEDISVWLQEGV